MFNASIIKNAEYVISTHWCITRKEKRREEKRREERRGNMMRSDMI
jgi:hypothetical protein